MNKISIQFIKLSRTKCIFRSLSSLPHSDTSYNKVEVREQNPDDTDFKLLKHPTKVPQVPCICEFGRNKLKFSDSIKLDEQTLLLLERLSLVGIHSKEALKILQDSIDFASIILDVDVTGVEPLYSVLEDRMLRLREDEVTDGNIRDDILKNARVTEEEYFVAPPGNIPLEQEKKSF